MFEDVTTADDLMRWVDAERRLAISRLDPTSQRKLGQFFTPSDVAIRMAAMLAAKAGPYRLLDPGAGIGVLSAAAVAKLVASSPRPTGIHLTVYEIDSALVRHLRRVLSAASRFARRRGVRVDVDVRDRFEALGFDVAVAWGHIRGIDIEARRGQERWAIEAKGESTSDQVGGNYFLNALGELLQRMSDESANYAIDLPENRRNLGLVARFRTWRAADSG